MQCTESYCSYTVARVIIMSGPTDTAAPRIRKTQLEDLCVWGGTTLFCYCNKMPEVRYFTKKWI